MNRRILLPLFCGFALLSFVLGISLFYIEQQLSYLASILAIMGSLVFFVLLSFIIRHNSSQDQSSGWIMLLAPDDGRSWPSLFLLFQAV